MKKVVGIKTMNDGNVIPILQQNKTFTTEFRGVRYDYYLTGPIGDAEDYLDLCNILRSATAQDEIIIRINCPGGSVNTGNMIINAISESEANVIGFIESECGSMATFIFLACHTWGVSEAAEFFAHTCSYGAWGKEHENFAQAEFLRNQQHKMTRKRYKNFLDEDQIERLLLGQDVYLNADEIMERLETYDKARAEECECGECGAQPTLEDVISDLVDKKLASINPSEQLIKNADNILDQLDVVPKKPRSRKQKAEQPE